MEETLKINDLIKGIRIKDYEDGSEINAITEFIDHGADSYKAAGYDLVGIDPAKSGNTVFNDYVPHTYKLSSAIERNPVRNADRFETLEDAEKAFNEEYLKDHGAESIYLEDWTRGEVECFLEWLFLPSGPALPWFSSNSVASAVDEMFRVADSIDHGPTASEPVSPSALLRGAAARVQEAYKKARDEFENRLFTDVVLAKNEVRQERADEIEELKDNIGRLSEALRIVSKTLNKNGGSSGFCNISAFDAAELRETVSGALMVADMIGEKEGGDR